MSNPRLPFDASEDDVDVRLAALDRAGRARAVDPRRNVVLEASAGTGKTRVLVDRYVNLVKAGVAPSNILAMTFTRKAAAEMRERIMATMREAALRGEFQPARWRELQDRAHEVAIGTIDAFCLSLLREFPLEADLDPGFTVADETEARRLIDQALDAAMRTCRSVAQEDGHVALALAQLGNGRSRAGLAALLARRTTAPDVLRRFLARVPRSLTIESAAGAAANELLDIVAGMVVEEAEAGLKPGAATEPASAATEPRGAATEPRRGATEARADGVRAFASSGPAHPAFMLLVRDLEALEAACRDGAAPDPVKVRVTIARARGYFLTEAGAPRVRLAQPKTLFPSPGHWARHRAAVAASAPRVAEIIGSYRSDLNALVVRGVWRMYRIAETEYRRTLDAHASLDFADLLAKTLQLLSQMDEFARSRYRLESRYHHVLLDEFQDTSRAQWELVSLLVQSWGEGAGLAEAAPLQPSIFVVGDAKQSIYRFRDADVSVLGDAARYIEALRPGGGVRRSISRSFRSVPALLSFVNDVCHDVEKTARADAFRYDEQDRFPVEAGSPPANEALGAVMAVDSERCAEAVAAEIERLLAERATVRDPATGVARAARPDDMAILFRTRDSHRAFEESLDRRGVPSYVYKGLGLFDADEVRDLIAVLWHLADPRSNMRAAAWLRSGFVRLSDEGLRRLRPAIAEAITSPQPVSASHALDDDDARTLERARAASARWRDHVDRVPPAELLDIVLNDSAYAFEMRGPRFRQARENVKKIRGMVRRVQNRGYATVARVVSHLDRLAIGDEANAATDAAGSVSLMTVHAAKGLEFPVVFIVNLTRGTGGVPSPIRLASGEDDDLSVSIGEFRSGLDEDEAAIELEETKRLLYVALTRARDRLYLSAVVRDGLMKHGRGSLAEALPASLRAVLAAAAGASAEWQASSGAVHGFRVCAVPTAGQAERERSAAVVPAPTELERDYAPLPGTDDPLPVTWAGASGLDPFPRQRVRSETADLLCGRLVHRLIERLGFPQQGADLPDLAERARLLIEKEDAAETTQMNQAVLEACRIYRGLTGRRDLRALFEGGEAFYEVPFVAGSDEGMVRGTIDCIIRRPSAGPSSSGDRITVLEFKTGRPRQEHHGQALFYKQAAERVFPGAVVEAWVVYPEQLVSC